MGGAGLHILPNHDLMNWERERWVKIYTRDSSDWLFLSFDAQALFLMLLRKVDRAGYLPLGRKGVDAVPVLLGHAGAADRISAALKVLLDDGCVRLCGEALHIPNFEEAQESITSPEERKRRFNELHGAKNAVERNGTQKNAVELTDKSRENRQEEKVLVASKLAPGSAFQAFVLKEWPDIRNPADLERRGIDAYPMLNLLAEAKKAKGWEIANPARAKKKHGTFFWGWLGKAKQFLDRNQPDAVETERASARASRDIAKTRSDITKIASVVPEAPSPEVQAKLKALMKGIGT